MAHPSSSNNINNIAILSTPGVGHLLPMAQLATHLAHHHGLSVTLITLLTNHSHTETAVVASLPKQVTLISIPPPPTTTSPSTKVSAGIVLSVASNLPYLRNLLASLSHVSVLIVDIFGVFTLDIARELKIPMYVFYTASTFSLSTAFEIVDLQDRFHGEYRDLPQPVQLPGCAPIHGRDFPELVQDRGSKTHADFLRIMENYVEADGILLNSFEGLERGAISYLKERKGVPPVFPVGPLVWSGSRHGSGGSECLKWLDEQPMDSVIYISFGSGGTLTSEQMEELAWGLEMSGLRFLWVVRRPHSEVNSTYFNSDNTSISPSEFLPAGFMERTERLGLIVPTWAPQLDVLAHKSIGGFMTHCGWNSVLESVVSGVPMVAWPLYAEQQINAVLIAEDLKVAVRVKTSESGLVERREIARVIKCLMEEEQGEEMRSRVRELSDSATQAVGEGGGSFRSLSDLVNKWKRNGYQLHVLRSHGWGES